MFGPSTSTALLLTTAALLLAVLTAVRAYATHKMRKALREGGAEGERAPSLRIFTPQSLMLILTIFMFIVEVARPRFSLFAFMIEALCAFAIVIADIVAIYGVFRAKRSAWGAATLEGYLTVMILMIGLGGRALHEAMKLNAIKGYMLVGNLGEVIIFIGGVALWATVLMTIGITIVMSVRKAKARRKAKAKAAAKAAAEAKAKAKAKP